jgi:hypothetical protein
MAKKLIKKPVLKKAQSGKTIQDNRPYKRRGINLTDIPEANPKNALKDLPARSVELENVNVYAPRIKKSEPDKKKMGGMIKRADGSMSKRGLWDNIRANKGSGKKPTAQMLKQEKKIKAQTKKK